MNLDGLGKMLYTYCYSCYGGHVCYLFIHLFCLYTVWGKGGNGWQQNEAAIAVLITVMVYSWLTYFLVFGLFLSSIHMCASKPMWNTTQLRHCLEHPRGSSDLSHPTPSTFCDCQCLGTRAPDFTVLLWSTRLPQRTQVTTDCAGAETLHVARGPKTATDHHPDKARFICTGLLMTTTSCENVRVITPIQLLCTQEAGNF